MSELKNLTDEQREFVEHIKDEAHNNRGSTPADGKRLLSIISDLDWQVTLAKSERDGFRAGFENTWKDLWQAQAKLLATEKCLIEANHRVLDLQSQLTDALAGRDALQSRLSAAEKVIWAARTVAITTPWEHHDLREALAAYDEEKEKKK